MADEQMDPKFRARRLRAIKRLIDGIPDSAIAGLENYVMDLYPPIEDDDDPVVREAAEELAAERVLMDAPMATEKEQ